nr:hypothetical protein DM860_002171 [Ipomoea batatas]
MHSRNGKLHVYICSLKFEEDEKNMRLMQRASELCWERDRGPAAVDPLLRGRRLQGGERTTVDAPFEPRSLSPLEKRGRSLLPLLSLLGRTEADDGEARAVMLLHHCLTEGRTEREEQRGGKEECRRWSLIVAFVCHRKTGETPIAVAVHALPLIDEENQSIVEGFPPAMPTPNVAACTAFASRRSKEDDENMPTIYVHLAEGRRGCGGVLRKFGGEWMGGFMGAIVRAWGKGIRDIEIQSDAKNVVDWIHERTMLRGPIQDLSEAAVNWVDRN